MTLKNVVTNLVGACLLNRAAVNVPPCVEGVLGHHLTQHIDTMLACRAASKLASMAANGLGG
jgi:hypothetical protein